jgi:cysteine-rich repeat protein
LKERRRFFLPLAVVCAALAVSCGPNEQAQTVSFVLSAESERLNEIEFAVRYANGKFAATDGQCVVSSAAGPRSFGASEARLIEMDDVKMMSRKQKRAHAAAVRVAPGTTVAPPTSTTLLASAALPRGVPVCGNGELDIGEECDDDNVDSNDGCDGNCQAEFLFSAMDDEEGKLTIHVVNGKGLVPGSTLAFCKFQGDLTAMTLAVTTNRCRLSSGGECNVDITEVTTSSTTTTTTTTRTTTTTLMPGESTTTSTIDSGPF